MLLFDFVFIIDFLKIFQDYYLSVILDGILKRAETKRADENELESLQSILVKLVDHFDGLEDAFALVIYFLKYILVT